MKALPFLIAAGLLGSASAALASSFDLPSMIQVGGGTAFLGGNDPIAALFKVEAVGAVPNGANTYFIIARVKGDAAVGASGVSYVDLQLNSVGFQRGSSSDNFWGMTLVNLGIQRNLPLNDALTLRVSLVGIQGAWAANITPDVKLVLRGALDLIGVGYTQRASDGQSLTGLGSGASGEAALQFNKRFRIALGEKLELVDGRPVTVNEGNQCDTYTDTSGNTYTDCHAVTATRYLDTRAASDTYLSLVFDLTQNLHLFGQASYNVYVVDDLTGSTESTASSGFQFFLGVSGDF